MSYNQLLRFLGLLKIWDICDMLYGRTCFCCYIYLKLKYFLKTNLNKQKILSNILSRVLYYTLYIKKLSNIQEKNSSSYISKILNKRTYQFCYLSTKISNIFSSLIISSTIYQTLTKFLKHLFDALVKIFFS